MRRFWVITVALLGTAAVAVADDAAITKQLLGRWTTCVTGGSSTEPDGTIRYDKGGVFTAEGQVKLGGSETADVRLEGTWRVEDGTIVHKVTKSSHPGLAPVGGELREKVVSIDEKTLTVKRGVGKERERKRME
ncbi:hypothetical protein J0H58_25580 [bacterium]|nr:hypothetical protein [bacterium]